MAQRLLILAGFVLVMAWPAYGANQATLAVDQSLAVQSNAFRNIVLPVTDGIYQLRPRLEVDGDTSALEYYLQYEPALKVYFESPEVTGVDHYFTGNAKYHLTPQDSVRASTNISNFRAIRASTVFNPVSGGVNNVVDDDGSVLWIYADLGYSHSFSARTEMRLATDFQIFDYDSSGNVDNRSATGTVELTHYLTQRFGLGLSVVGRYRNFDPRVREGFPVPIPGTTTGIVNANLLFFGNLTPTLTFRASGGPSGVALRQANLSYYAGFGGPLEVKSEEVTYFASASLIKKLKHGRIWADYVRTEDASSGIGQSALFDRVTGNVRWDLTPVWRLRGVVGWRNRQFENDFFNPGVGTFTFTSEIADTWLDTSVIRLINDRISVQLRFRYDHQFQTRFRGLPQAGTDFDNFTGAVTLRYEFEPFRF